MDRELRERQRRAAMDDQDAGVRRELEAARARAGEKRLAFIMEHAPNEPETHAAISLTLGVGPFENMAWINVLCCMITLHRVEWHGDARTRIEAGLEPGDEVSGCAYREAGTVSSLPGIWPFRLWVTELAPEEITCKGCRNAMGLGVRKAPREARRAAGELMEGWREKLRREAATSSDPRLKAAMELIDGDEHTLDGEVMG